jgi:hypothetical protein
MRTALALLPLALAACASAPPRGFGPPPDFALSVTLLAPPQGDASVRPAWYVLDADGQLRAALGERLPGSPVPPIARHLSHREVADLWHAASAAGFTGPAARDARAGARDIPPVGLSRPTALVYVAADGQRRSFQVDLTGEDSQSAGAADLAQRLLILSGAPRPDR